MILHNSVLTGQQALARAIYARCELVLLDDSFSALDGSTESRIVKNLLSPGGFFKRTGVTVFLMTNSGKFITPQTHPLLRLRTHFVQRHTFT